MEKHIYYSKVSRIFVLAIDFLLIFGAYNIAHLLSFGNVQFIAGHNFLFVIFCLSWWIVSGFSESTHRVNSVRDYWKIFFDLMYAFFLHAAIVSICSITLRQEVIPQRYLTYLYALSFLSIAFCRFLLIFAYKHYKRSEYGKFRKVIIVGAGHSGSALYSFFIQSDSIGHRFMGFFDDNIEASHHKGLIVGGLSDLKTYCLKEGIEEIYFAQPLNQKDVIDDLTRFADDNFIYFRIVPDFSGIVQKDVNMYFLDSIPVITIRKEPLEVVFNKIIKRTFDIAFSLAVILFIFPIVLPIIALAIKLSSEGPVFFTQLRPGKKNRLFKCYKFRTMRINNQTELQATKYDPRITNVGRFLRKTNLDELPQFFNVLLGDMSVVGPRPNMINQLEEYSKVIEKYKVRHFVNPGITGYAQVNGYRGETKQLQLMQKRVEYDVMYMENWSFFLDIKIIFLTVWNMIKGEKNAY
jgi:putative colanic acid biosynthesis UDP-glucose lipid carrier transferase